MQITAFERRANLIEIADRKQRQVRALAFVIACAISFWASTIHDSKASAQLIGWLAGAAWLLFIATVIVHRRLRARAQRLKWRMVLEKKLDGLRGLVPSAEVKWNLETANDENGRAVRRLIRDLDILPSSAGLGSFAALFPFFLSTAGQNRFLQLLTRPVAEISEILRRQKRVRFWERRTVLRRKILRISSTLEEALNTESLIEVAGLAVAEENSMRWLALVAAAQVLFFGLWAIAIALSLKWIGTVGLVIWIASYAFVTRRVDLFSAYPRAMLLGRNLRVLRDVSIVLNRISHLPDAELGAFAGEKSPVTVLQEIERTSGALGTRQNPLLALLINFVVPWDLFWTIRFDRARRKVVGALPAWLDGLADLEACIVFAEWNAAHGQAWPEFLEPSTAPVLVEAKALAHPLLSPLKRVPNDLLISRKARNHLITGSNMSGKSTFLRAIGLNLLLAHAGAKVTAQSLRLIPLRLESSMRPADSLSDGFSSFYSEVSDLVEIVKQAEIERAVFYLIDEIFRGTNNRERRIGAEAVIRALAKTSAMGFVTTHDLDLAALEGVVDGLENHHFRDDVVDGLMSFSYEYRFGPCPSTNALKVMRTAGLPVPEHS